MLVSALLLLGCGVASARGARELILGPDGHVRVVHDPWLGAATPTPAPAPARVPRRARRGHGQTQAHAARRVRHGRRRPPTVSAVIGALERTGAIAPALHRSMLDDYIAARHLLRKLSGTRAVELGAVLANLQAMAADGELTGSRAPALALTLRRNLQWWNTGPLLSSGQRVGFPGSDLVWEYYPGQGIEIQWLGTFGEANGLWSGHRDGRLRRLMDEVIPLASARAGGIAWEYLFHFDGGVPPWTSGLSQGTAIQALARAWQRLHDTAYLNAAQTALGIFQLPPPDGVRQSTPAGARYLQYTFAPGDHILNGEIQALVGLYDYTAITGDRLGEELFAAGDAQARLDVPQYDTGAWSLYDQYGESDLSYHELLTNFLEHLCQRTTNAPDPLAPPAAQGTAGGAAGPSGSGGPSAPPGGAGGPPNGSGTPPNGTGDPPIGPIGPTGPTGPTGPAGAQNIYCVTAAHFSADLRTPPVLTLLTTRVHGGGALRFRLSKISHVSLTLRRRGRLVYSSSGGFGHGVRAFAWPSVLRPGTYTVTLSATGPAGHHGSTSGTVTLPPPPRRHHRRHH